MTVFLSVLSGASTRPSEVVGSENDILRRSNHGTSGSGREDVIRRKQELTTFHLSLHGKRHMHSHLVTIKVRIVCTAGQRVQTNGRSLNEDRFEGLDRKTVKSRSPVEHHGVTFSHISEDVPDFWSLAVDHLLGRTNRVAVTECFQTTDDEGLKESQRHLFGKTTLAQLELRSNNNDGATRVVNSLTEKVLAETSTLTLEHVRERLEGTVTSSGDSAAVATVIIKSVTSFLKHALLVADDDLRGLQLHEITETVVPINDATVEVIKVGSSEAATFQRNQRTKVRWNHWKNGHDHPLRASV